MSARLFTIVEAASCTGAVQVGFSSRHAWVFLTTTAVRCPYMYKGRWEGRTTRRSPDVDSGYVERREAQ
jgi:hypothetical protein